VTIEELTAEFKRRRLLISGPGNAAARALVWAWFVREKHKINGDVDVYWHAWRDAKRGGVRASVRFVRELITPLQYWNRIQEQSADIYLDGLESYEVATVPRGPAYRQLTREAALEAVKALRPFIGTVPPARVPTRVTRATAVIWYRYAHQLHELAGFPSVIGIAIHGPRCHEENEFLDGGAFNEFRITPAERAELRAYIGLGP
jgi:hypothetical protein